MHPNLNARPKKIQRTSCDRFLRRAWTQTELLKMIAHGFGHKPHVNRENPPVF